MGGSQLVGPDAEVGGVEADAVEALGGVEDGRVTAGLDILEEGFDRALEAGLEDGGGGAGEEAGLLGGVEVGPAADGEDRHGAASVADRRAGVPRGARRLVLATRRAHAEASRRAPAAGRIGTCCRGGRYAGDLPCGSAGAVGQEQAPIRHAWSVLSRPRVRRRPRPNDRPGSI